MFASGNEYAAMAGYPGAYPDYISVAAVAAMVLHPVILIMRMEFLSVLQVETVIIIRVPKVKYIPQYHLLPVKMVGIMDTWKERHRLVHMFRE